VMRRPAADHGVDFSTDGFADAPLQIREVELLLSHVHEGDPTAFDTLVVRPRRASSTACRATGRTPTSDEVAVLRRG